MSRHSTRHGQSDVTRDEAMRIARGRQRPGQTREQTKLIAQGIQEGIKQYRKQQSAKGRALDRKLKKVRQQDASSGVREIEVQEKMVYRQHWLPWALLVISWLVMAACWLVYW